jgi:hypothetical protein
MSGKRTQTPSSSQALLLLERCKNTFTKAETVCKEFVPS